MNLAGHPLCWKAACEWLAFRVRKGGLATKLPRLRGNFWIPMFGGSAFFPPNQRQFLASGRIYTKGAAAWEEVAEMHALPYAALSSASALDAAPNHLHSLLCIQNVFLLNSKWELLGFLSVREQHVCRTRQLQLLNFPKIAILILGSIYLATAGWQLLNYFSPIVAELASKKDEACVHRCIFHLSCVTLSDICCRMAILRNNKTFFVKI